MLFAGKLNKLRTFGMGLIFLGFFIMFIALLVKNFIFMSILMVIGFLAVILSTVLYFWVGLLSSRAVPVECPSCNKVTKMLGKEDDCMFCKQKLSLEPETTAQN